MEVDQVGAAGAVVPVEGGEEPGQQRRAPFAPQRVGGGEFVAVGGGEQRVQFPRRGFGSFAGGPCVLVLVGLHGRLGFAVVLRQLLAQRRDPRPRRRRHGAAAVGEPLLQGRERCVHGGEWTVWNVQRATHLGRRLAARTFGGHRQRRGDRPR